MVKKKKSGSKRRWIAEDDVTAERDLWRSPYDDCGRLFRAALFLEYRRFPWFSSLIAFSRCPFYPTIMSHYRLLRPQIGKKLGISCDRYLRAVSQTSRNRNNNRTIQNRRISVERLVWRSRTVLCYEFVLWLAGSCRAWFATSWSAMRRAEADWSGCKRDRADWSELKQVRMGRNVVQQVE